eukprot:g563.t1
MPTVAGAVSPGYEAVKEAFQRHVDDGVEECAQVCVYAKGECVVDLWACPTDDEDNYGPSSIQNIFSSTKCLTSLVVAMLVDRKRLRYEQRVCDIWPEYAAHGKEETTVAMLMRHEAGLPRFGQPVAASQLLADRIRQGSMSALIAEQKPLHKPGAERQYHSLTRGWIVNEVVRRADEQGRTIGEFLRDEVAVPLGLQEEVCIGVTAELDHKVKALNDRLQTDFAFNFWHLLVPSALGGGKVPMSSNLVRVAMLLGISIYELGLMPSVMRLRDMYNGRPKRESTLGLGIKVLPGDLAPGEQLEQMHRGPAQLFNMQAVRRGESPSANGHASARALAKIAATIVGGGVSPASGPIGGGTQGGGEGECGVRIMSEAGVAEALAGEDCKTLFGIVNTWFTNAGWCDWKEQRMGYVGWMGLGGSVLQWHPEMEIGFGYTANLLELTPANERGRVLQAEALRCARAQAAVQGGASVEVGAFAEAGRSRL